MTAHAVQKVQVSSLYVRWGKSAGNDKTKLFLILV